MTYYGVFPVQHMRVHIESSESQTGVFHGITFGYQPPFTRILVGRHTQQVQLTGDWMMTHELVHTAFPEVAEEHHWIKEGIATHVEQIARVQAGQLSSGKSGPTWPAECRKFSRARVTPGWTTRTRGGARTGAEPCFVYWPMYTFRLESTYILCGVT